MALNWKINVASPILTLGMSFQVRYRKLNTQNWNNLLPNPTTNEFTIYNLENGDYEAEIRTVCTNGDLSNPVYHSTGSTSNVITAGIAWSDDTNTTKTGNSSTIEVKVSNIDFNPSDPLTIQQWESWNGSAFVFHSDKTTNSVTFANATGLNRYRLKIQSQSGQIAYSNVLEYQKNSSSNLLITNVRSNPNGGVLYDLTVTESAFVGYANTVGTKRENCKILNASFSYGESILITNGTPINTDVHRSTPVNIPVGSYPDCSIMISATSIIFGKYTEALAAITFGLTNDYYELFAPNVSAVYIEEPIEEPTE